jgi:hypothetical protein
MLILFIKSKSADPEEQMPLPEKLRRIFILRVKEAKTDKDREREKKVLKHLGGE